jgi:alkyldihydroxyacetonephosphate synthase
MSFTKPKMMKWYGWGHSEVSFLLEAKPKLQKFIAQKTGLSFQLKKMIPSLDELSVPPSFVKENDLRELTQLIQGERFSVATEDRLLHGFGKSYPDLYRQRVGDIQRLPDIVFWPKEEVEILKILDFCKKKKWKVIPFGGGTNIVGATEIAPSEKQVCLVVSLRLLNKVLEIDKKSHLALIQAGAQGPEIEAQLNEQGFTLGHFPDSFEFSTLGGWIATRSAGMQSDEYGKIEDMVQSVSVIGASEGFDFKPHPASSVGVNLNHLFIGSEGKWGLITKAWMRIHPLPAQKMICGFLFRNFHEGLEAIRELYLLKIKPSMIRLQDEGETELAKNFKATHEEIKIEKLSLPFLTFFKKVSSQIPQKIGFAKPVLMIVGCEGMGADVSLKMLKIHQLFLKRHCLPLGPSVGQAWAKDKFHTPYLRDALLDYEGIADVAETSTSWSRLESLHRAVIECVGELARGENIPHYVGCHLSHSYDTGACLYFTWAVQGGEKPLERYYLFKRAITECILNNQGTLSHHHALGREHRPWLEREIGSQGVQLYSQLKTAMDPENLFLNI